MSMKHLGILPTAALCAAGLLFAQQSQTPSEKTESVTKETPSKTTHKKEVVVIGKVKEFKAGDKLTVETPKGHSRSFDLNAKNTNVSGAENLQQGEMVKITQTKEGGQTNIRVEPYHRASR